MEPNEGFVRSNEAERCEEMTTCLLDLPDHIIVENIIALLIATSLSGDEPNVKDLRDIFSFASTCTRIHELSSHPSLWRNVNAEVFWNRFVDAMERGFTPPPLPLGANHCGLFVMVGVGKSPNEHAAAAFIEALSDLTVIRITKWALGRDGDTADRISRMISSYRHITRLDICGKGFVKALCDSKVPPSIENLRVHGVGISVTKLVRFISTNSFPSLTQVEIPVLIKRADGSDLFTAIVRSCPVLVKASFVGSELDGPSLISFASGCQSLRVLQVTSRADLTTSWGTTPPVLVPHIRALVVNNQAGCVFGKFLSAFPELVRLELERTRETDDDLRAIGGMMNLEHLMLDGGGFVDESCRRLLPLVNHPMTRGRRSLKSLTLWNFDGDLSDFLSSPWCSQTTNVAMACCSITTDAALQFITAHS